MVVVVSVGPSYVVEVVLVFVNVVVVVPASDTTPLERPWWWNIPLGRGRGLLIPAPSKTSHIENM